MAAPFAPVAGANGAIYRNTGSPAIPFWVQVSNVRDVENPLSYTDNDVSSRTGGGFKQHEPALGDLALNLTMLYDPYDANLIAFGFFARTKSPVDLMVLDQVNTTNGSQGFRAVYKIFNWNRKEPVDGQMEVVADFKPCYFPTLPPSYIVT